MKELNTLAGNAIIKLLQREVLLNTKGQYMKESNILVGNATIKQQQKDVLLNTKGQYTKESNTLAVNVVNNSPERIGLQDTIPISLYIEANKN